MKKRNIVFSILKWISPIIPLMHGVSLVVNHGKYPKHMSYGHKKVQTLDTWFVLVSWIIVGVIVVTGKDHYSSIFGIKGDMVTLISILFPYLQSFYLTVLLYGLSGLVEYYSGKRSSLIDYYNQKFDFEHK